MAQDFARIHQVVGVERVLDLAHDLDGGSAFLFERGDFAQTDAVLTGAGAAGLQRQIDELGAKIFDLGQFALVAGCDDTDAVVIAIADVAEERRGKINAVNTALPA